MAIETPTRSVTPLVEVDFDALEVLGFGQITDSLMAEVVGYELEYFSNEDNVEIVEKAEGDMALRQRYEPTSEGSDVVEFPTVGLPGGEEMWLSYDVMFEPGWQWVLGGKLPGLAGGTNPSGRRGGDGTDGFSARMMWRADGRLVAYVYHPDRPADHGEDFALCGEFEPSRWLQVTQRVVMNTAPDRSDASIEIWVDGGKYLEVSDLRLRTEGDFGVDVFVYSSFYGGQTAEWAPSETTHAQFDNFRVGPNAASVGFVPNSLRRVVGSE